GVADVDGDEALGGGAALALGDALETLDADQLHGLGLVTVRLVERLLDVEHARAGGLADLLAVCCRVVGHVPLPCRSCFDRDGRRGRRPWRGPGTIGAFPGPRVTRRPEPRRTSPRWPLRREPQRREPQRREPRQRPRTPRRGRPAAGPRTA